jgi:hypothetical protein
VDLTRLRPAYNGTALAAAAAAGAPAWAHTVLADMATVGDGTGPLGATAFGLLAAGIADRALCYRDRHGQRHDLWAPRAAIFAVALGPLYDPHARELALAFLTGALS